MFDGRQIRQRLQNNHLKDAQRTMEEVEKVKKMIYEQNGNIMKRQKSEKKKRKEILELKNYNTLSEKFNRGIIGKFEQAKEESMNMNIE